MRLYPAIDILEGNAVRLVKGDFDAKQTYERDPLAAALAFAEAGAEALHVVDLDGARAGEPVNLDHLGRIAAASGLPVQYGGGLRSAEAVDGALAAGASRVILGTAALKDPALLEQTLRRHGDERVMVSVDTRGGLVTVAGWTETGTSAAAEVLASLISAGVSHIVYTDVDRDGMLEGPDLARVRELAEPLSQVDAQPRSSQSQPRERAQGHDARGRASTEHARLIYSGGIGSLADLEGLAGLSLESLEGVIVGKALYERRFTVPEAMRALAGG